MSHLSQAKIDMRCATNVSHVKANAPATLFVAVDVKPVENEYSHESQRLPLKIVLAIDCSGSTQADNNFEYARQAAISLFRISPIH